MVDELGGENRRIPMAVRIQFEAARRLGLEAEILDPEYGYLFELRSPQRTAVLYAGRSPLNDSVAARICEDKYYTELVLRRAGFRVVQSVRCLSPEDFRAPAWAGRGGVEPGLRFAVDFGYPVVVKPNRMSHGYGVQLVASESELRAAIEEVWRYDYCALVQQPVGGVDLRLDFLDDEYLIGYARRPLVLVGDGKRSLRTLLADCDSRFADDEYWNKVTRDRIWQEKVLAHGWNETIILPRGMELHFEATILNLNRWALGTVIPEITESWRSLCGRVGKILNLRHFGVDFKAPSPNAEPEEATIIEVNSSPLLTQLYRMGRREAAIEAQMKVLKAYFDIG